MTCIKNGFVRNDWAGVGEDYSFRRVNKFSNKYFNYINKHFEVIFNEFVGRFEAVKKNAETIIFEIRNVDVMFEGKMFLQIGVRYSLFDTIKN